VRLAPHARPPPQLLEKGAQVKRRLPYSTAATRRAHRKSVAQYKNATIISHPLLPGAFVWLAVLLTYAVFFLVNLLLAARGPVEAEPPAQVEPAKTPIRARPSIPAGALTRLLRWVK
jgi:hypothetical protein